MANTAFDPDSFTEDSGLVYAMLLDGNGGARHLSVREALAWTPDDEGLLWMHLDYSAASTRHWVAEHSGLDTITAGVLLSDETRPRVAINRDQALVSLRGVNLNPSSDPEDMVSVRISLNERRIVSTRTRRMLSIADLVEALDAGEGPHNAGQFIVMLARNLTRRLEDTIDGIEDQSAELEEKVVEGGNQSMRSQLAAIRRETILLRRYLAPQREALLKLYTEKLSWLSDANRVFLREVIDGLIRNIEDLDSVRDRSAVTHEELSSQLSDQMNSRLYVLSLVAAIFLPLGFLTGLLGINVGGIPGAENHWSFAIVTIGMAIIVGFQVYIFRKRGWF